jgi:hypothetical protein
MTMSFYLIGARKKTPLLEHNLQIHCSSQGRCASNAAIPTYLFSTEIIFNQYTLIVLMFDK